MAHCAIASHKGKQRPSNQDSYLYRNDLGLFIVADGMGGHEDGKLASSMACDIVCQHYQQGDSINEAIEAAHTSIQVYAKQSGAINGMGTTLLVLQCMQSKLVVSWVGDSRAYLFCDTSLTRLTKDHSVVQTLLDNHLITEQEALNHPKRNLLTQSVGLQGNYKLNIDSSELTTQSKGEILLCSDGLWNELSENEIKTILQLNISKEARVQQLVNLANEHGGSDNITAMLVAC